MTPERWQQIAQLYETALDRSPDTRAAFLAEQCGTDEDVRREVEALLAKSNASLIVDRPLAKTAASVLGVAPRLTPGTTLGPYRVDGLLGAGGMGEVYRARDTKLNRDVALKVLPETFTTDRERVGRFLREAQVLASLNDPHIAAIHGYEDSGDIHALVLELVEGPTLADRIARGPVPLDEALAIARQIADALATAHDHGIIHRDLKPANVKLRDDGTVKVLDFGLAKALTDGNSVASPNLTNSPTLNSPIGATGVCVLLGAAAYMSPEQAKGRAVDKRSDIWAFGCVLHEMLTGEPSFKGEDLTETVASVVKDRPDLSHVPRDARRLIAKCLEKDPKARLRDIGDAWALLDLGAEASSPSATARPTWRLVAASSTLTVLATLAFAGLAVVHLRETPPEGQVIRSTIAPPENTVFDFDVTVGPVVISPDGRMLAFTARSSDGRRQLWIRPLDAVTARPLDGTDGAIFPFWSPDGLSVGFFRAGTQRLFRVQVSGGPPIPITEAAFVRGASWGRGGTIIFDAGNALWTAPAGGGPAVRRTTPDFASGETHRSPYFLQDGRHYLYWVGGKNQILVGSLDSEKTQVVTDGTSSAIYASGHLLFLRESTLLAAPFDPARLVIIGEAVPVADHVLMVTGEPRGVFTAADNGTLVYQTADSDTALSLAWFDRSGRRLSTVAEVGDARNLILSPNGGFAIAVIGDPQRRTDL